MALPFHDDGTRRGWGVSVTPRPLFTPGKNPVPIVQETGWAPGPVWAGAENRVATGIRSPDCPARSQSRYRLRYPAHSDNLEPNTFYGRIHRGSIRSLTEDCVVLFYTCSKTPLIGSAISAPCRNSACFVRHLFQKKNILLPHCLTFRHLASCI